MIRGGPSCVWDVSGVCCMRVSAWSGISYVYMRFKPWIYFGIHRVHWEYSCFCALAARRQADREFNSLKLYNGISNVASARGKRERERNQKTTGSPKEPKQQSEIGFNWIWNVYHWHWNCVCICTCACALYWPQVTHSSSIEKWNGNLLAEIIV